MKRRKFFKNLLIGVTAAITMPKLLIENKEKIKLSLMPDTHIGMSEEFLYKYKHIIPSFPGGHMINHKPFRIINLGDLL